MLNRFLILISICLLLAASCDPDYYISYVIDNQSDNTLQIIRVNQYITQNPDTSYEYLDTSLIVAHTKLLFDSDFGRGRTYYQVQSIDSISPHIILNQDSIKFKRDITDIDNWDIDCTQERACSGTFTLIVTNEDFQ